MSIFATKTPDMIKGYLTSGEALLANAAYKLTNSLFTLASGTDTVAGVSGGSPGQTILTTTESADGDKAHIQLFDVNNVQFMIDVYDANADCHNVEASANGAAGGTTIVDTVNRTEADNYWRYYYVYLVSTRQWRRISGFANATGTITVDRAFTNADGTVHQVVSGEKYYVTRLVEGVTAATLHTDGKRIVEETVAGGTLAVKGSPQVKTNSNTLQVKVEFVSET